MNPATYNLLEGIVRAITTVAEASLPKEAIAESRSDLHGKLMSVKNEMRREDGEDIVQATAKAALALARYTLSFKVDMDSERVQKKHLLSVVKELTNRSERRHALTEATLHPTGHCTCEGQLTNGQPEGECEWCREHCVECGMELDMDRHCPNCYEDGKALAEEVLPDLGDEQAPEEPVIDEYVDAGLDSTKWRLINDTAGNPVAALWFNGQKDSLTQEQVEDLEEAISEVVRQW